MKRIIAFVLCFVLIACMFTGCKDKAMTMDELLKDTNTPVGSVSNWSLKGLFTGKNHKLDIYAYEVLYLMNMEYTADEAFDSVKQVKTLQLKAIENGVVIDKDAKAEIDKQINNYVEQFGSKEALTEKLKEFGVTYDQFYAITTMSQQASMFQSKMKELKLFTEADDKEAKEFFDQRFLKAKHILFSTRDTATNEEYDDKKKAEQKQKAEDTLKKIKGGEDFDSFMSLSEDPGAESQPDGYVFAKVTDLSEEDETRQYLSYSGLVMVEEFENAVAGLKEDEISGIVESNYGYHIIKRLKLTDDDYEANADMVKSILNNKKFMDTVDSWEKGYKIKKYSKLLNSINIEEFKEKAGIKTENQTQTQPEEEVQPEEETKEE